VLAKSLIASTTDTSTTSARLRAPAKPKFPLINFVGSSLHSLFISVSSYFSLSQEAVFYPKMPRLSEVSYSHNATIAAITDYFEFLASMYMKESAILRPPEGGWPQITADGLREHGVDKTDEVVHLLRHLPYIDLLQDGTCFDTGPMGTGFCPWVIAAGRGEEDILWALMSTEGSLHLDDGLIPPHVIGLTKSRYDHFMLDTKLGVIYWPECVDTIRFKTPSPERIFDDPWDSEYTPEREGNWRGEGVAWPAVDFFELLKDMFRRLFFVPLSSRTVWLDENLAVDEEPMVRAVQTVYREHGWPDLERFRKHECLRAVEAMLQERFPEMAPGHEEYEYE
jgi:hypothetical protein